MHNEAFDFRPVTHPELPQLERYLSEDNIHSLRLLLTMVANKRVEETDYADYDEDHPYNFEKCAREYKTIVDARPMNETDGYSAEEKWKRDRAIQSWKKRLGLTSDEIHELLTIGNAFTEKYNEINSTRLSPKEGRDILLQLACAHQIEKRANNESAHRRYERIRRQVLDYLKQNTTVRHASEFVDRLPEDQKNTWRQLSPLNGYGSSSEADRLRVDYKTADGNYGVIIFDADQVPFVINGRTITDRDTVHNLLERYAKMSIRVYTRNIRGDVTDSCHDLTRLFEEIHAAK